MEQAEEDEREGKKGSSLVGVMRDKDVGHVLDKVDGDGERKLGSRDRRQTTIRLAIQDLWDLLCREDACMENERGDNDLNAEREARGRTLVVLVGEVERSARGVTWNERNRRAGIGYQLITKLWRRVGVRAVAQVHDLPSPPTDEVPDVVFDRLLEALLWRLPRPPGPGIRGGTIRGALGEQLGSPPGIMEAERTVEEVVAGWKRCCELAQAWNRSGGSEEPSIETKTVHDHRGVDGGSTGREKSGNAGGSAVEPKSGPRTSALLGTSHEGIRGASDTGVFQALRTIRGQMRVGTAGLEWKSLRRVLNSLLSRSAQQLLRRTAAWDRTRAGLL